MKGKRFTAFCLCALMVLAGTFAGCKAPNKKAKTQPTETTQAVTETVEGDATPATEETSQETTAPATQESTQPQTQNNYSDSSNLTADPKVCIITVDNKDYSVSVGSVVTYTCYLKTPDLVEDVQAIINYTGASLQILDDEDETMFPVLGDSVIYNSDMSNIFKFNAVKIKGFDFKEKATLVTLRFKVITGVSASIATSIEFLTEKGGVPYIEDCKVNKDADVKYEESLKY